MSSASGENVINILVIKQSDGDDMHDELPDLTDFLCPAQPQQFQVSPSLSSQYYDPADHYDISRPPQSQESSTSARPALTKSQSFTIVDSPQRLPCHNNTWWSSAGQQPLTLKEQPYDLLVGDQVDRSGGGNKGNKCGGKLVKHKSINIPPVKESRAQVCPSPTHSFNLSHDPAPSHTFTPTRYSSSTPHPGESQWRRRLQTEVTSGTPDSGFCTPSSDMFSPPSLSSYREADSCLPTVSLNKDSEIFSPSTPTLNKHIRVSDGGETSQSCDKAENEDNEEELETSLESVQWLQGYSLEQALPPLYTSVASQCNHPGNPSSLTSQVNSVTCSTGGQEIRDAGHNSTPDLLKPLPVIMAPLLGETHRTPVLDTQPSHRPALAEIQINTLQAGPSTQPKKDVLERPRYSYTDLIKMALQYSTEGQLTLREIVGWIQEQFPYFKHRAKPGWRNSIRHNLSLHPDFVKEGEKKHGGKWRLAESGHKPFPKVVKSAVRRPPAQPKMSTPLGKKCFRTGVQPILPKSFPYALVPLAALCTHPNLGQPQLLQQQQQQDSPAPFTYINGQLQQLLHQQQHHPPVHTVRHQPPLLPKPQTCASNDQPKVSGSSAVVTVWPYHGQTSQVPIDGHCSEVTVQNSSHEVNAGGAGGVMTGQHVSRMFGDNGQVRPAVWSPQHGEADHRICTVTEGTSAVAGWLVSSPDTGHSSAAVTKPAERQTSGQPRSRPICKLVDKIYRSKSFDVESRSTPDRGPHNPGRLGKKVGPSRRRASVVNTASVLTEDVKAAQTIDQLLDQDSGWGLSWDVNCGSSVETVNSCPSSGQTVDSHPNSEMAADSSSSCLLTADSDPNCGSMLSLIEQAWQEAQTKTAEHGCPTEWESQEDTLYTSHPAFSEGDTSHTLHTPPPPSSECLTPSVTQAFTVFNETSSSLQWTDMASQPHLDRQCDTEWQSGRTKSRRKQVHIPLTTEVSPGRDKDGVVS